MLKGIIARTTFENEAVDRIEECDRSMAQLKQAMDEYCMLCVLYSRNADCLACPIETAALAKAKWHRTKDADDFIAKEKASG